MSRWPVDGDPVIASPYKDPRRNPPHFGIDLAGKAGDAVRAPEDMVIADARSSATPDVADNTNIAPPWKGYGPGIVVGRGTSGKFHLLAHLGTVAVVRAQVVRQGELLGKMATHVGASGPHTHWEVRDVAVDDGPATREQHTMDPHVWLDITGGTEPIAVPATVPLWLIALALYLVTRSR